MSTCTVNGYSLLTFILVYYSTIVPVVFYIELHC